MAKNKFGWTPKSFGCLFDSYNGIIFSSLNHAKFVESISDEPRSTGSSAHAQ